MPVRKLAALSGLHVDTAASGLRHLVARGLAELRMEGMARGGRRTFYRLSAKAFWPADGERFGRIGGGLVYGGLWSKLPSPAARQLYLLIACLDPIGDEDSYAAKLAEERDIPAGLCLWIALEDIRAKYPLTYDDLARLTGLSRRSVAGALKPLTAPIQTAGGPCQLVRRGASLEGGTFFYAPDRNAENCYFEPACLNSTSSESLPDTGP